MFQFLAKTFVLPTLIVAMSLMSIVPATGACEVIGKGCESEQDCCMGLDEVVQTCCSTSIYSVTCNCSVEQERPTTPLEQRTSDERDTSRLVASVLVASDVCDHSSQIQSTKDSALFYCLSSSHSQAVLCRWLT